MTTNYVTAWPVDANGSIVTSGSGKQITGYLPEGTMPVGDDGGVLGLGSNNTTTPVQRNGTPVVQDWTSATVSGGGSVITTTIADKVFPNVTKTLKLTGNAGGGSGYKAISTTWPAARGCKTVAVRVRCVASSPKPVQFRLYDAALTKYLQVYGAIPNDGQWHSLIFDKYSLSAAAGFVLGTDEIRFVQVREERGALGQLTAMATDGSEYIEIGNVSFERATRAKFMFTVDDSQFGMFTQGTGAPTGYPASGCTIPDILSTYGYVGTLYCIPRVFGTLNYESVANLQYIQSMGWDMATHSQPSEEGQIGNSMHGLRTIGTFGLGPFNITAVASNALTIASHPFGNSSKVSLKATVAPAGTTLDAIYWTRNQSASTVTLHTTRNDALNNVNPVVITDSGTGAYLQWADAVGKQAIIDTLVQDKALMKSYGFGAYEHYALPQGGWDKEVLEALQQVGFKTVRGIAIEPYVGGIARGGIAATAPAYNFMQDPVFLPACYNMSANTDANIKANIDRAIEVGGTTGVYCHLLDASDAVKIDSIAAYIKSKEQLGLIDVVTISQWNKQMLAVTGSDF